MDEQINFQLIKPQGSAQVASLVVCLKYKEMYGKILKSTSLTIVKLYPGMSNLNLEINVNLPQLLCIGDLVGFALTVTIRYKKETRVESSSAALILCTKEQPPRCLLHADWMMLNNSSNQCGANSVTFAPWHTKSMPQMLIASKAAFLGNFLAVSAWILNGSSIECHKKKCQPFSLSGVRFGNQAILISERKSSSRWSGRK